MEFRQIHMQHNWGYEGHKTFVWLCKIRYEGHQTFVWLCKIIYINYVLCQRSLSVYYFNKWDVRGDTYMHLTREKWVTRGTWKLWNWHISSVQGRLIYFPASPWISGECWKYQKTEISDKYQITERSVRELL